MHGSQTEHHMVDTYLTLRRGMAIIAFFFPIILLIFGPQPGLKPEPSISAYYYVAGTLHELLIGVLCAIGVCLILYKGPWKEDWALNIGGVSVILVAFLEMKQGADCVKPDHWYDISAHGFFAVIFFLTISYVCIFLSKSEPKGESISPREAKFYRIYKICGFVMLAVIVGAVVLTIVDDGSACKKYDTTFWIESFGIWTFSAYWYIKTIELDQGVSWVPSQFKFWGK
jgi:hypothetical protein